MFLSKRKNGIWHLWVQDGVKHHAVSCRPPRKDEALRFVKEFKVSRLGMKTVDISLANFSSEYLAHIETIRAETTVAVYRITLQLFQQFAGSGKSLKYISAKDAYDFQSHLINVGLRESTVNEYLAKLRSAHETVMKWEYIYENPFRKVQRLTVQKQPSKIHDTRTD